MRCIKLWNILPEQIIERPVMVAVGRGKRTHTKGYLAFPIPPTTYFCGRVRSFSPKLLHSLLHCCSMVWFTSFARESPRTCHLASGNASLSLASCTLIPVLNEFSYLHQLLCSYTINRKTGGRF